MAAKVYDAFISLGLDCEVAAKIKAVCGSLYPQIFNWGRQELGVIPYILKNGVEFLLDEPARMFKNMFYYKEPGIGFHGRVRFERFKHYPLEERKRIDACLINEVVERHGYLFEKFQKCVDRFENILFIVKYSPRLDQDRFPGYVYEVQEALRSFFHPRTNFDLLAIAPAGCCALPDDEEGLFFRETGFCATGEELSTANLGGWFTDVFSGIAYKGGYPYYHLNQAASLPPDAPEETVRAALAQLGALGQGVSDAGFQARLGALLRKHGDLEGAQAALRRAVVLGSKAPEPYFQLSQMLGQQGLLDEAIAMARDAVALRDDNPRAYQQLGNLLLRQGDLAAAEEALRTALRLDPEVPGPHVMLSHVYNRQGRLEQAIAKANDAIAARGDNPNLHRHLGRLLARYGDAAGAAAALDTASRLEQAAAPPA